MMRIVLAARAAGIALVFAVIATGCSGTSQDSGGGGGVGAPNPAVPGQGAPRPPEAPSQGAKPGIAGNETATTYLSTFALDVDTASYGFARRALADGRMPDPATVRPEEFVNQFRQGYPEPEGNGFSISTDGGRLAATDDGDVRMLRVGLQTKAASQGARRDANLTFVVDTSGSMDEPGRLDLVKDALHTLVDQLRPSDRVAIVAYESEARMVQRMTPVSEKERLHSAIDKLQAGSSTNLEAGMVLGYEEARRGFRAGVTNRVIIASDGLANTGATDSAEILRRVSDAAHQGVSLLCVGVGSDYGDSLMEELADHGNGRAVYVSERAKARELFVRELPATLELRARDAKAQVAFDSAQVESFRLIGYDNRGLKAEDFRDDTVDGGEIGPGHSVTALYAVRLRPGASGHLGDIMVRWQDPDTRKPQENGRTITVSDLAPDLWSAGSPRLRIDATAAYFAEILRDGSQGNPPRSPYVTPAPGPFITHGRVPGESWVTLDQLADHLREVSDSEEDPDVKELSELIGRARTV
jgi:Ca-activated chloride channel family protein